VRERRPSGRRSRARSAGAAGAAAAIGLRLWAKVVHRPLDSVALLGAAAASLIVVVNAVFLQTGPHRAPFFANPAAVLPTTQTPRNVAVSATPKLAETALVRPAVGQPSGQPISARRNDPIGDLIASSIGARSRVAAVQRVLSEFGYGQIRPSGVLDEPTSAAIGRFETEHKLPVTGRLSDRLLNELSAMTGHPIE